ncbi:MAG: plasmid partitioning protein RepA, partial [Alphaproteobacteria bacterium HGW-Alphaproteobacteria-5]
MNEQRIRMDQKIQTMATRLSKSLDVNMRKSFLPDERKALRRFSSTEVAQILGVSQDFLRKMFFEDKLDLGEIETDARGRRFYTAEQIDIARHEIARSSTKFQH